MFIVDAINDLCEWECIFTNDAMHGAAWDRHARLHERRSTEAAIISTLLRKASREGFSGLTERERLIVRAYSVGADLPVGS